MQQLIIASAVVVLGLAACGKEAPPAPVEKAGPGAATPSAPPPPTTSPPELLAACCPRLVADRERFKPEGADPACRQVSSLLEHDQDAAVIETLLAGWGPDCYARIPADAVLATLRMPAPSTRALAIKLLGKYPPSPAIAASLLDEVERTTGPLLKKDDPRDLATWALAGFGEDDLGPTIAALASPTPRVRASAAAALGLAAGAPLDLPEALVALEQAAKDPDMDVASQGRDGVARYRRWDLSTPESRKAIVTMMVASGIVNDAIRNFGYRRFSCGIPEAQAELEALTSRGTFEDRALATLALRERARRCAAK